MACWDGGAYDAPEDEREQQHAWEDSDDGDMPWAPNPVEKFEPWKEAQWGGTPEEQMYRDQLNNDQDQDGA